MARRLRRLTDTYEGEHFAQCTAHSGMLTFGTKLPFRLGRLPGDIVIKRDAFTFYLPLGTSILISVVLTGVLWLLRRRP